jgi:DNA-binding NtrC family response regulator
VVIDDEQNELNRISDYLREVPVLSRWVESVTPQLALPDVTSVSRYLMACYAEIDIVLADLYMPLSPGTEPLPDGGYSIIRTLASLPHEQRPQLVVISGKAGAETSINEYRARYKTWFRYLQKPATPAAIRLRFQEVDNWRYALEWAIADLSARTAPKSSASETAPPAPLKSAKMQACWDLIGRAASSDIPVLLLGESGVGKSYFARQIHQLSSRSLNCIVECNCAAIPETMAESELFGHEAGAFPGATQRRKGKFELAGEGTLFLDEVGELSMETQAKLLRVLQDKQFERLGGDQTLEAKARLICATLRPLDEMVRERRFRSDVLNRIDVFPIYIPALRDRREEILPLAHQFLERHDKGGRIQRFSSEAALALTSYDWPDNIRGLENMIQRAVVLTDGDCVQAEHLTVPMVNSSPGQSPIMLEPSVSGVVLPKALSRISVVEILKKTATGSPTGAAGYDKAAETLGCTPSVLRRLMHEWGLDAEFPPTTDQTAL